MKEKLLDDVFFYLFWGFYIVWFFHSSLKIIEKKSPK